MGSERFKKIWFHSTTGKSINKVARWPLVSHGGVEAMNMNAVNRSKMTKFLTIIEIRYKATYKFLPRQIYQTSMKLR